MALTHYERQVNRIYRRLTVNQLKQQIITMISKIDKPCLKANSKLIRAIEELNSRGEL